MLQIVVPRSRSAVSGFLAFFCFLFFVLAALLALKCGSALRLFRIPNCRKGQQKYGLACVFGRLCSRIGRKSKRETPRFQFELPRNFLSSVQNEMNIALDRPWSLAEFTQTPRTTMAANYKKRFVPPYHAQQAGANVTFVARKSYR